MAITHLGLVGLEKEVFAYDENTGQPADIIGTCKALSDKFSDGCLATSDAGKGHLEYVTPPRADIEQSFSDIEAMQSLSPSHWVIYSTAWRPKNLPGHRKFVSKPRFNAMLTALAQEKPCHWQNVFDMADASAVHVNIGISPWVPDGMLILNLLNNVGPYIAYQTRTAYPESAGHMSLWGKQWARESRLPRHGEWYRDQDDFKLVFCYQPKLVHGVGDKDSDLWEVDLVNPQELCPADLGVWWKLARPKVGKFGWYIELRILPSMPNEGIRKFVTELLYGVAAIKEWSHKSGRKWVCGPEDAYPALCAAYNASPLFPHDLLSKEEWIEYFNA